MGCTSSKADNLPLVALCRERRELLRSAADNRYELAAAHASYFRALDRVGDALHRFATEELVAGAASPILTLPPSEGKPPRSNSRGSSNVKGENVVGVNSSSPPPSPPSSSVSPFSGSHLDDECDHLRRPSGSDSEESFGKRNSDGGTGEGWKSFQQSIPFASFPNENYYYMKAAPTISSTVYEYPDVEWSNAQSQRFGYDYGYGYGYPSFVENGTFSYEPPEMSRRNEGPVAPASEEQTQPPPPPPPPPPGSSWDFFNPFDSYEQMFDVYAKSRFRLSSDVSSPNSSEVREQEGIPDLEEETEQESVKETENRSILEEKRVVDDDSDRFNSSVGSSKEVVAPNVNETGSAIPDEQEKNRRLVGENLRNSREVEEKKHRKERPHFGKVANTAVIMEDSGWGTDTVLTVPRTKDVVEAVKEITEQFKSAASCGEDVSRILEVGKMQYRPRISIFKGARMLKMNGTACADFEKYISAKSSNLSSTLEQLYMWEKKLYKEVKDEEKLRLFYEREFVRLKALDDRGAESNKIDSTQTAIDKLIMKISMTIKSVDAISRRIHKLRDEELRPQIVELIHGLIRMWSSMLDCHQRQFQAIFGASNQKYLVKSIAPQSVAAKATSELELELINWCSCFSNWVKAQKAYIEKLNKWLMKWLLQEQEDPPSGTSPFSPATIGAPAIFIVSNDWHHVTEKTSEDEVLAAMHAFVRNLRRLCESQDEERQQKLRAEYLSKDFERRLKALRKHDTESEHPDYSIPDLNGGAMDLDLMRRRIDEEKAKHVEAMKQIQEVASCSLKTGLIPIFEALESYSSESLKHYSELRVPTI